MYVPLRPIVLHKGIEPTLSHFSPSLILTIYSLICIYYYYSKMCWLFLVWSEDFMATKCNEIFSGGGGGYQSCEVVECRKHQHTLRTRTRTKLVLEMLIFSPFKHLKQLVARKEFIAIIYSFFLSLSLSFSNLTVWSENKLWILMLFCYLFSCYCVSVRSKYSSLRPLDWEINIRTIKALVLLELLHSGLYNQNDYIQWFIIALGHVKFAF